MTELTNETSSIALYNHTSRKDWGVAILVREEGGKRGYLFENGEERTMANGYHQLMRLVEAPSAEQIAFYERQSALLSRRQKASSAAAGVDGPSFLDQLDRLHKSYSEGLTDPKWVRELRGQGAELRAPKHRDALIRDAQEQLGAPALDALIKAQSFAAAWDLVTGVLGHADLVPAAQLKKMKGPKNREGLKDVALAARELLHGKTPYEQRFEAYLAALAPVYGEAPHWEAATALSAAFHPTEHVSVHPTSFRAQLKALGGRSTTPPRATGAGYLRFLSIARLVSDKLKEQETPPRDFFDVYDFIRLTSGTPPKPKAAAAPAKSRARSSEPPAAESDD